MTTLTANNSNGKLLSGQKTVTIISSNKNHDSEESKDGNQGVSETRRISRPASRLRRIEEKMRAADLEIDSDSDSSNNGWDTDLESEISTPSSDEEYDDPRKASYANECKKRGLTPVSYFLRHINDKELNLGHHGLGPKDIKLIAQSLATSTCTYRVDLRDNWLEGEGANALANMMKENCYIRELNLADNRIRTEGAIAVTEMLLHNTELLNLDISGNDFEDNDAELLADPITKNFHLQTLNLNHNKFSIIGGQYLGTALAQNDGIEDLDLSWNHLRKKGAHAIAMALKSNVRLKYLNLSWNGFADDGAAIMGESLKSNNSLLELDLSNNRIGVKGAKALALGLAVNDTLKVVKMSKNPMYAEGCQAVLEAICKNTRTTIVELQLKDIVIDESCGKLMEEITRKLPHVKITHGGFSKEAGIKGNVSTDPMAILQNYIDTHNLRVVDIFNRFDRDNSRTVDRKEFLDGMKSLDVPLTKDQMLDLIETLDLNSDGQIEYGELLVSSRNVLIDKRSVKKKQIQADQQIKDMAKQADASTLTPPLIVNSSTRKSLTAISGDLLGKDRSSSLSDTNPENFGAISSDRSTPLTVNVSSVPRKSITLSSKAASILPSRSLPSSARKH